jgi:hypothetical protein
MGWRRESSLYATDDATKRSSHSRIVPIQASKDQKSCFSMFVTPAYHNSSYVVVDLEPDLRSGYSTICWYGLPPFKITTLSKFLQLENSHTPVNQCRTLDASLACAVVMDVTALDNSRALNE